MRIPESQNLFYSQNMAQQVVKFSHRGSEDRIDALKGQVADSHYFTQIFIKKN